MGDATLLENQIADAAKLIPLNRPIYAFAANNPLDGYVHMPFEKAFAFYKELVSCEGPANGSSLLTLSELLDRDDGRTDLTARINSKVVLYVGAYCDQTQAQWSMERSEGLLHSWRAAAQKDFSLSGKWKKFLHEELSDSPLVAIEQLLSRLGVHDDASAVYLRRHLFQLPGWAGYLKWRQHEPHEDGDESILCDYLVIRLFYELAVAQPEAARRFGIAGDYWAQLRALVGVNQDSKQSVVVSGDAGGSLVRTDLEIAYRDQLLSDLAGQPSDDVSPARPDVQIAFCIDVRSGPAREWIEAVGGSKYQTFGAAGFFGVLLNLTESGSKKARSLCPIICLPTMDVQEVDDNKRQTSRRALSAFAIMLQKKLKANLAAAFGFVDIMGPVYAFSLLFRTMFPGLIPNAVKQVSPKVLDMFSSKSKKAKNLLPHTHLNILSFSVAQKVEHAYGFLRSIGLTENFADTVVFCGHESSSKNNPFAASLECGACGGNTGRFNSRVLADILNDQAVRDGLKAKNVHIPSSTIFIGALHNTCTDRFTLFKGELPDSHKSAVSIFERDLEIVGEKVRAEREAMMPRVLFDRFNDPITRSEDAAQVIPELGLLGNKALIIGPRAWTRDLKLQGEVFLHSHKWEDDPDGSVLQGTVSGALVVASGINMQYFTSAVDNEIWGSGGKTTLNPKGGFGVIQGARGDLKIGLTEQSVQVQDGVAKEAPMRLLVVINAPLKVIDRCLVGDAGVTNLVNNGWLNLVAFEPALNAFYQCDQVGSWRKLKDLPV